MALVIELMANSDGIQKLLRFFAVALRDVVVF
jgi:hypothetical protein